MYKMNMCVFECMCACMYVCTDTKKFYLLSPSTYVKLRSITYCWRHCFRVYLSILRRAEHHGYDNVHFEALLLTNCPVANVRMFVIHNLHCYKGPSSQISQGRSRSKC